MIESLKEAKEKKREAERKIEQILNELVVTTGFLPTYVNIDVLKTVSGIQNVIVTLRVEVE